MHTIQPHKDPYYSSIEGLELIVDGHTQAVLKTKGENTDLVFQIRGPIHIDQARPIIIGLLDLLVHYDKMAHKKPKS
jgi:hypothetical protein